MASHTLLLARSPQVLSHPKTESAASTVDQSFGWRAAGMESSGFCRAMSQSLASLLVLAPLALGAAPSFWPRYGGAREARDPFWRSPGAYGSLHTRLMWVCFRRPRNVCLSLASNSRILRMRMSARRITDCLFKLQGRCFCHQDAYRGRGAGCSVWER